jgi:hypothetical protein
VIADNVLSHVDALGAYSRARQADPTLESVTVPSTAVSRYPFCCVDRRRLPEPLHLRYRGKEVVRLDRFQYGQWRYQRVRTCPQDLRGIV